jgi:hypothetical protein
MCGKAPLFRQAKLFLAAAPLLTLAWRIWNGGIAAKI